MNIPPGPPVQGDALRSVWMECDPDSCYPSGVQVIDGGQGNTMKNARHATVWLLFATIAGPAVPAAHAADEPVVEKLQHGQVNWTTKTIMATGSGAPNMDLPNVAAIRLAAERAAKTSAYRNVLEAIQGVRITARTLGGEKLGQAQIKTQVQGIVTGCKTVDTRYFNDLGVDVVVECKIDGGLAMVLSPPDVHKPIPTAGERKYTGLIIDAVGTKAAPAISPRVTGADGTPLYAQENVKPSFLRRHGAASYFRSVEAAKKSPRVGDNPIVLRAAALGEVASDIRVASEDLERLKAENLWFLLEGRVAVATDGP